MLVLRRLGADARQSREQILVPEQKVMRFLSRVNVALQVAIACIVRFAIGRALGYPAAEYCAAYWSMRKFL